jgi:ABC-type maltose transport system permease subunit
MKQGQGAARVVGAPVTYGLTIPNRAPHPEAAARFAAFCFRRFWPPLVRAAGIPPRLARSVPCLRGLPGELRPLVLSTATPAPAPIAVKRPWLQIVVVMVVLAAIHVGIGLAPMPPFSSGVNLALFFTNLFVFYTAATVLRQRPARAVVLFVVGLHRALRAAPRGHEQAAAVHLAGHRLRGILWRPGSAGLLRHLRPLFRDPSALRVRNLHSAVAHLFGLLAARGKASRFARLCLCGGLLALTVVLFPLIHLGMQDSMQTLWRTFTRGDVASAIWLSMLTSTIATVALAIWAVPLAYALARIDFPGKRWVESIVDVPILVPQSVPGWPSSCCSVRAACSAVRWMAWACPFRARCLASWSRRCSWPRPSW